MERIPKIVLTGGPCAGKTTALNYLSEKLSDYGFSVFHVPEVATMVINAGVSLEHLFRSDYETYLDVEAEMMATQLLLEDMFQKYASLCGRAKSVILCDRGIMDISAYVDRDFFERALKSKGLTLTKVRDGRYDAVVHLVSAAHGAEAFYTCNNNSARRETLEQARAAEEQTKKVWVGHPHLKVIDNRTNFELKMRRTLQAVCRALGVPVPLEIERKFLVAALPDFQKFGAPVEKVDIEQMYLRNADGREKRIRKRGQDGSYVYYQTFKQRADGTAVRTETEMQVSQKQYAALAQERDPAADIIKKNRHCFLWKNQYFEFDEFIEPVRAKGLCVLEIELTEEHEEVALPDFVSVVREVTGDSRYSNFGIASGLLP